MSNEKIIRPKEAAKRLSISMATLYRLDDLPPKVQIGENSVGYYESELNEYIQNLRKKSGGCK